MENAGTDTILLFACVRANIARFPIHLRAIQASAQCLESSSTWLNFVSSTAKIERCGEATLDVSGRMLAVSSWSSSDFSAGYALLPAPQGDPDSVKTVLPLCICIESDIANDARTSQFSPLIRSCNHQFVMRHHRGLVGQEITTTVGGYSKASHGKLQQFYYSAS